VCGRGGKGVYVHYVYNFDRYGDRTAFNLSLKVATPVASPSLPHKRCSVSGDGKCTTPAPEHSSIEYTHRVA